MRATGETLLALDGKTYTLDDNMCVIADDERRRIARRHHGRRGVRLLGSHHRRADRSRRCGTRINIAQTGRKLGIDSDARYRFERGVDPAFMLPGLELATRWCSIFAAAKPSEIVVAGEAPDGDWR